MPKSAKYEDFVDAGRRLATDLRKQGAELIIAMTHMRVDNDQRCAEELGDVVDLVLGGHDHFYSVFQASNGCQVVKSGTDFREMSAIYVNQPTTPKGKYDFDVKRIEIDSSFKEDPSVKAVVDKYMSTLADKMKKIIFETETRFDVTTETVRTKESVLGNLMADIMRDSTGADIAVLNGGSCRSDEFYGPGPISIENLLNIFPSEDNVPVKKMNGVQVRRMMEVSVGKWPTHVGRFLQVSGVTIKFDPKKQTGNRLTEILVNGEPLDPTREYKVAMRGYMSKGMDGYEVLTECPYYVDDENAQDCVAMIRNYMSKLKVATLIESLASELDPNAEEEDKSARLRKSGVVALRAQTVQMSDEEIEEAKKAFSMFDGTISEEEIGQAFRQLKMQYKPAFIKKLLSVIDLNRDGVLQFNEFLLLVKGEKNKKIVGKVAPKIEGRIVCQE